MLQLEQTAYDAIKGPKLHLDTIMPNDTLNQIRDFTV